MSLKAPESSSQEIILKNVPHIHIIYDNSLYLSFLESIQQNKKQYENFELNSFVRT